uniref:Uncharacterized protein n=1 Tax=Branchiostoma floridae TaxID=7739 RepID=C3Z6T0_BRAFL|eukprot:XP_002595514.1 hypothetical protein BRAFLDRAFT_69080 [Branchiostoma floridae]
MTAESLEGPGHPRRESMSHSNSNLVPVYARVDQRRVNTSVIGGLPALINMPVLHSGHLAGFKAPRFSTIRVTVMSATPTVPCTDCQDCSGEADFLIMTAINRDNCRTIYDPKPSQAVLDEMDPFEVRREAQRDNREERRCAWAATVESAFLRTVYKEINVLSSGQHLARFLIPISE